MAQTKNSHSKRNYSKEILDQSKTKRSRENTNSTAQCLLSKIDGNNIRTPMRLDSPGPPEAHIGYLWAALPGGQLSSTDTKFFCYLQCPEISFATKTSYNGLSSTPSMESDPATYFLDSVAFKNFGARYNDPVWLCE